MKWYQQRLLPWSCRMPRPAKQPKQASQGKPKPIVTCDVDNPPCQQASNRFARFPCPREGCQKTVHLLCSAAAIDKIHPLLPKFAGPISLSLVCSQECVELILQKAQRTAPRKADRPVYWECACRTLEVISNFERPALTPDELKQQTKINKTYPPPSSFDLAQPEAQGQSSGDKEEQSTEEDDDTSQESQEDTSEDSSEEKRPHKKVKTTALVSFMPHVATRFILHMRSCPSVLTLLRLLKIFHIAFLCRECSPTQLVPRGQWLPKRRERPFLEQKEWMWIWQTWLVL